MYATATGLFPYSAQGNMSRHPPARRRHAVFSALAPFPPLQRGVRGDLPEAAAPKSPQPPLTKGGKSENCIALVLARVLFTTLGYTVKAADQVVEGHIAPVLLTYLMRHGPRLALARGHEPAGQARRLA
jgi:hypothetical protein